MITYDTDPSRYAHWRLAFDGPIATLTLDIQEDRGIKPGYKLKLNSYDLGVDMELHDAVQRIRFEHPEVKCVVITSGKSRMFCSGANIYMLGLSTHAWKVNFCKFTNETRNGLEDSSERSGLKFLAALNGATAGGGYELALACDEIAMIDDRSTSVSLPEVPLLGVLPGTGGLTRLVDKRKMRRDLADVFCTTSEGVRAERAKEWKLVDHIAKPQQFEEMVKARAAELAKQSDRPGGQGIALTPLNRKDDDKGYHYNHVDVEIDRDARTATLTVTAPMGRQPDELEEILTQGARWWPLAMARELDDAILMLRTNDLDVGLWQIRTRGDMSAVLEADATMAKFKDNWFVRETIGMLRRCLRRLDVSSRSMFAVLDEGSCFGGLFFELALAADRSFMLKIEDDFARAPKVALSEANFGLYPMNNGLSRLATRFAGEQAPVDAARATLGKPLQADQAAELGLVTFTPDELDWDEELRIAIEERTALSPDALTGMEASLRFAGSETMDTRIFGRLTAWQNWIFNRPNAVGEAGALKVYGTGAKAKFNWERV
ncbi:MAG: benzoyl-CoA-dihydrodiol lyase [Rhodocyclaceae bacterium]|jgi:benzoyl-CoA-dihydrodiol lyase|uniref:Benzoyl-CoA-dihydrodiol lyase n=1 Tax=Candidatus Desulfobacillus denitrificans TaxID=2608985 RepID=A0A809R0U6_9PROT|nr:benzoyl-CoA-dihydrodiol lyase [Candidatus Desulfobacillus denitrificans]GIK46494.1 MAG: benzoyl-CoA-dihydrodiol lyase [Betaproteobacteria bacterium]GJQ53927.1 MAG: benzoyl-CoA-dihydrodiol lyase [Rhodocyclaceae bacterium]